MTQLCHHDVALAYTADLGWHLIPSTELAVLYGDLEVAVTHADHADPYPGLCRHDQAAILQAIRRGFHRTDINRALGIPEERPGHDLLEQLRATLPQRIPA